ncbi:MAG: hypothetical protein ACI9OJ_004056 [Myxococcota bacterium]|jgi:hypothetical protein
MPAGVPFPTTIDALPFGITGTTVGLSNDHAALGCGFDVGGATGLPDAVYEFTATSSGTFRIANPSFEDGEGPSLYSIHESCDDIGNTCVAGDDFFGNPNAFIDVNITADTSYVIVVDSYDGSEVGSYELTVTQTCTAACEGSCGTCEGPSTCGAAGLCESS